MASIKKFDLGTIESVAKVLGDTGSGFTGTEIGRLLSECGIEDVASGITKWKRLNEALTRQQYQDGCANNVCAFIQNAMKPVRHVEDLGWFDEKVGELNKVLAFEGLKVGQDGKLIKSPFATTITEAKARANRLKEKLLERDVHRDVLIFCKEELLNDNYFHAVFEATKSVADKIRSKSGLLNDGAQLVDDAFSFKSGIPYIAINKLESESEQSEQKGFMNLLKGLFGTFRNVTAHVPKIKWEINEIDALDILSLVSLIHRRLDKAIEARKMYMNR